MFPFLLAVVDGQNSNNPHDNFEKEALPLLDVLYNLAYRLTGSEKGAYKLLLETHINAFRFYDHLDTSIDFKSWMFRVLRNTYKNSHSKKIKTDKTGYKTITDIIEKIQTSMDFPHLKEMINKLTVDHISSEVSSLPDEFKMVVVMHDFEGFTYEETADFIDIPLGIVRSRLHRGRKMLFAKLYNEVSDKGFAEKIPVNTGKGEADESRDLYLIAALVDRETVNALQEEKLKKQIEESSVLKYEFEVQSYVKSLLSEKLKPSFIPLKFKKKLLRKIR